MRGKPTPVFHARISQDGSRLELEPSEKALRDTWRAGLAGQRVEIIIRRASSKRSVNQNAWWWGIAIPMLAEDLGYDEHEHEMLHYALVQECFGSRTDRATGQIVPNVRSSLTDTKEFAAMMEWVVRWAATERGLVIPLPGEAEAE